MDSLIELAQACFAVTVTVRLIFFVSAAAGSWSSASVARVGLVDRTTDGGRANALPGLRCALDGREPDPTPNAAALDTDGARGTRGIGDACAASAASVCICSLASSCFLCAAAAIPYSCLTAIHPACCRSCKFGSICRSRSHRVQSSRCRPSMAPLCHSPCRLRGTMHSIRHSCNTLADSRCNQR